MNTSRFSEIKAFLKRHGLRVLLPLLLLLLFYTSYTISREPVSSGLSAVSTSTRYLLPAVALLSVVGVALGRYFASLSLLIGYHLGVAFAMVGADSTEVALAVIIITLLSLLLVGVWLEVFSALFTKWKKEADTTAQ